jgi:3-dehydroquinate dehydratase II
VKKIAIINGPNLNLLGEREQEIYGFTTFEDYLSLLSEKHDEIEFSYFQSNVEGELINALQEVAQEVDGIILNAAGYTHTSVAIADTIRASKVPVVEVHISNIHAREEYRKQSLTAQYCQGCITGFGLHSYELGLLALLSQD